MAKAEWEAEDVKNVAGLFFQIDFNQLDTLPGIPSLQAEEAAAKEVEVATAS